MPLIEHMMKSKLIKETKVHSLNNSFLSISDGSTTIWMDPLRSSANIGAWAPWSGDMPCEKIFHEILIDRVDYIFISHLHSDHFDQNFLMEFDKFGSHIPTILIKDFKSKRLKEKILAFWPKEKLIEIPEYEFFLANSFELAIFPQISPSSVTSGDYINYDLDTACVLRTKDTTIYNEVDNPYSLDDYKIVIDKMKELGIHDIDIAFIGYSGASDYPQCHLNIDRAKESQIIREKCIKRFYEVGKLLKTKFIVPAGGNYLLDYPFDYLNEYICVPSFDEINNYEKSKDFVIVDTNNYFFSVSNKKINLNKRVDNLPIKPEISNYNLNIPYSFESSDEVKLKNIIMKDIKLLEANFPLHFLDIYTKLQTSIKIFVHKDIPKYNDSRKLIERSIYSWKIFKGAEKDFVNKNIFLDIHLSGDALIELIKGNISWDELVFHCLFLRSPNIYEPEALMFMNWYKHWKN